MRKEEYLRISLPLIELETERELAEISR